MPRTVARADGTISFLMDCDTTGSNRHRAGKIQTACRRRHVKIVNQTVRPVLEKLGLQLEEIERIIAHIDAFDTTRMLHSFAPA